MVGKIALQSSVNLSKIQKYLQTFAFDRVFQELGWDNPSGQPLTVSADGHDYVLRPLAEKRQVKVFVCTPGSDGKLPENRTLLKIEREVTRLGAFEHLIIYTDAARTQQAWQ